MTNSKITPNLWFDGNAEEAANFYCSIFPNSRIGDKLYYSEANEHGQAGKVMTVDWYLDGNKFTGINGGPEFKFNYAVSFLIDCDTQEEIDHYYYKLLEGGGTPSECGWLQDKYGLAWQVSPRILNTMLKEGTQKQQDAVTAAFLKMKKLDIAPLQAVYDAAK